jgi:GNAT superfamily N-acetyltransferase
VSVEDLAGGDEARASTVYRTVLETNFARDELVPLASMLRGMAAGLTRVCCAVDAGGAILGAAVGDWFPDSRVQLLSYIAIAPAARSRGVGTLLLRTVVQRWIAQLAPALILAEVEDPRHYEPSEYGDPVARLRLYERLGARSLPVPYFQPALSADRSRVPHLLLMVFAHGDRPWPGEGTVDGAVVERFLIEYLRRAEGDVRESDGQLAALLSACRRPDGVPMVAADRLAGLGLD